ncbi:MAG TPA: glycosyltransferase family 4 protein, partial [Steroidobacteraceae bacterium]|nr:glycosyltransferase family 4 protein [Steroidobacteraceae bacterium]
MTPLRRLAFIGNSLPRRCGIATFTTDLQQVVARARPDLTTVIVAMSDNGQTYDYPPSVGLQINDQNLDDYVRAAEILNAEHFDAICLQHEFGIFGGEAGSHINALLSRLTAPIVTTLHTVLAEPNHTQRAVFEQLATVSTRLVVMAEKAREILRSTYAVPAHKIEVIPHGIPDVPFSEPGAAKAKLGFARKTVLLTFGLLSPSKGIEVMIDAMPAILKRRPDAVYVVLGATHPNLVRHEGEAYRERLMTRARELGIEDHVVFLNQFVDRPTLLDFIAMCDLYITPYLHEAQMTSGTLAYSFGLGKVVVSTPYWHARELLADGHGVLVPFGDATALGDQVTRLLGDDVRRHAMRKRAYADSRAMTWERVAHRYLEAFEEARRAHPAPLVSAPPSDGAPLEIAPAPQVQLDHLLGMCDDTGLFQHAIRSVPDRSHGYCVDDNARGLLLACALNAPGEQRLPETLTSRLAAFVQHAWNPDTRRFRNFMSFDRRWLEATGSEDSHGRTLWALGECARGDIRWSRRRWAAALFCEALPAVEQFHSPRA